MTVNGYGVQWDLDAPANWYPDPSGAAAYRYWDGARWTSHIWSGPVPSYLPLGRRATVVKVLLVVYAAADLVSLGSCVARLGQLHRLMADRASVSVAVVHAADVRQAVTATLPALLYVAIAVAFLAWFARAYADVRALGVQRLRYGGGWAILAWLIPLVNYVLPKRLADDLWKGSDPDLPSPAGERWKDVRVPGLLHAWWAVFVAANLFGTALQLLTPGGHPTLRQIIGTTRMLAAFDLVNVVLAALAYAVVRALTARLEVRAARLSTPPGVT